MIDAGPPLPNYDNYNYDNYGAHYAVMKIGDETTKKGNYILVDSGAAVSVCPENYKLDIPLHFDYNHDVKLRAANGTSMEIFGKRKVDYEVKCGIRFTIDYYVCNTKSVIISTNDLTENYVNTTFGKYNYIESDGVYYYLHRYNNLIYFQELDDYKISANHTFDSRGHKTKEDY